MTVSHESSRLSWKLWLAVAWTALILVAFWIPARHLPTPEEGLSRFSIPHLDKIVHFTLFAGFGLCWMQFGRTRKRAVTVILAGIGLAILSELGQGIRVVHRDPSFQDALADMVGACAGVALMALARRGRTRSSEDSPDDQAQRTGPPE